MIDTSKLPREVSDRISLKMDNDNTYYRATEEDYTEELMAVLTERGKPNSNHSFISSCVGGQGTGKSYLSIALCSILDPNFTVDHIYFDYRALIYDRSKLKPGTAVLVDEQSEEYGLDSHRINIVLCALKEQLRKKSIHFIFCSPTLKEEYKCLEENTLIISNRGLIKVKDLNLDDLVLSDDGKWVRIKNKFYSFKQVYEVKTDFAGKLYASGEHRFDGEFGLKKVNNIVKGDYLKIGKNMPLSKGLEDDYYIGFFYGAFLADGTINNSKNYIISKYTGKKVKAGQSCFLRISNRDVGIKKELERISRKYFNFTSCSIFKKGITFYGKKQVSEIYYILGKNLNEKRFPVFRSRLFALGLLNGYANCDSCINLNKDDGGKKEKLSLQFRISSDNLAIGMSMLLRYFGIYPVIRDYKSNKWRGSRMRDYVLFIPTMQVGKLLSLLKIKNKWKKKLFDNMMKVVNKKEMFGFNKGNCIFIKKKKDDFYAKVLSKRRLGVRRCVDIEIDSENHLYQLGSGVISHNSSMYVLETMYIDYEEEVCYAAYKTRDLLTLGYVKIPHPLNFVTKEFLEAYEAKKDKHLDELTGMTQVDEIEDIAAKIIENDLFKRAELFYRKKIGYIPGSMVVQVINKLYPEFKSSIIVGEVAARIKLNKELDGTWTIPYSDKSKGKKK